MAVFPVERRCRESLWLKPETIMTAEPATECFLICSQAFMSGIQVCAEVSCGVSFGNSLVAETQRWSISPTLSRSPRDSKCRGADLSAKEISIRQRSADSEASCQRNVGGV